MSAPTQVWRATPTTAYGREASRRMRSAVFPQFAASRPLRLIAVSGRLTVNATLCGRRAQRKAVIPLAKAVIALAADRMACDPRRSWCQSTFVVVILSECAESDVPFLLTRTHPKANPTASNANQNTSIETIATAAVTGPNAKSNTAVIIEPWAPRTGATPMDAMAEAIKYLAEGVALRRNPNQTRAATNKKGAPSSSKKGSWTTKASK